MKRIGVNSIIGGVLILFSIFWNTLINKIPRGTKLAQYGPRFFPRIVLGGIVIIAISLIIQDLMRKDEKMKLNYEKHDLIKVFILIIVMIAYLILMPILGYTITTIIVLGITLLLFGLKNIKVLIFISVLFPVVTNYLFRTLLKVGLP